MSDGSLSGEDLHIRLDEIEALHGLYSTRRLAMAAALACGAFTFLLGGGPVEIALAFLGAGIGNSVRSMLTKRKYTLFLCVALSVGAACLVYAGCLKGAELLFEVDPRHEAGYICAMLFIIPGFPFITSGIDLAKQDMRSGLERLAYAVMIVLVAALAAWLMALLLGKENCPVVSAWQEDAVKEVLVKEAERLKAQLYQPKKDAIRNLLYDMNGMQFD